MTHTEAFIAGQMSMYKAIDLAFSEKIATASEDDFVSAVVLTSMIKMDDLMRVSAIALMQAQRDKLIEGEQA